MASEPGSRPPPRRRALYIVLAALVIVLLAAIAAAGWLLFTEGGARAALAAAASASGGMIRAQGVHGRLGGALHVDKLTLAQPERHLVLDDVELDWHPLALARSQLDIDMLHVGHIALALTGKSASTAPPQLPARIGLPLAVHVDRLRIDSGDIERDSKPLLHLSPLTAALDFDRRGYRVQLRELQLSAPLASGSASAQLHGTLAIAAARPYPLHGELTLRSHATLQQQSIAGSGKLGLSGSLAALTLAPDLAVNQATLRGQATLHPFAPDMLGAAHLEIANLDLAEFGKSLPHTALALDLASAPDGSGSLKLQNGAAGPYDRKALPLSALTSAFRRHGGTIDVDRLTAQLGSPAAPAGTLSGSASYQAQALTLALHADTVDLKGLDTAATATSLTGDVNVRDESGRQQFSVALQEPLTRDKQVALDAHGSLADSVVTLDKLVLKAGSGKLDAAAQLALNGDGHFSAHGDFDRFRLRDLGDFPQLPSLDLNGRFSLQGLRQPQLQADLSLDIHDSRLAGQPLRGSGAVRLRADRLSVDKLILASGANQLSVDGQLAQDKSQLRFALQAPQLAQLAQLGPDFAGTLDARGSVGGSLQKPMLHVEWHGSHAHLPQQWQVDAMQGKADVALDRSARLPLRSISADATLQGVRHAGDRVGSASLSARFAPAPDAPLALRVQAQDVVAGALKATRIDIDARGTTAGQQIAAALDESGQDWRLRAQGGLAELETAPRWQGHIEQLEANGRFAAHLRAPASLLLSAKRSRLDDFALEASSGRLVVDHFSRDQDGISTSGRIEQLQVGELLRQFSKAPPVRTDLRLGGSWNLTLGKQLDGNIRLQRDAGDVTVLGSTPVALGLDALQVEATANAGKVDLHLRLAGRQLGRIALDADTQLGNASSLLAAAPDAPLSGAVHIDVPSLGWVAPLASPGMITGGSLKSDVAIGGTLGTPTASGRIDGDHLRVDLADLGVNLRDGTLRGEFHDDRLLLQQLSFRNGNGQLAVTGPIDLNGGKLDVRLALTADHYQLLDRVDRKLTLSGNGQFVLQDQRAHANGSFTVDSGLVDIGQANAPKLADDVVIVGQQQKQQANKLGLGLDVRVDLGKGIKITGRGVDGTLVGNLHLQNDIGEPLQAYGLLRIEKGTFSAYGRDLKIEQGEVRFRGPLDNPSLTILAMRRGQEVEAGVAVRGSVLAPDITLVSEPEVADADKLSWLVLGHGLSTANTSDAGTLQDAAGSLLSRGAASAVQSRIAGALGLDTLSVGTSQDTLQQRIVTLGKQISSRLYLSYQQGLQSANSVVQLRYVLTPKLSLEAEAGARSALSLFYNITFH